MTGGEIMRDSVKCHVNGISSRWLLLQANDPSRSPPHTLDSHSVLQVHGVGQRLVPQSLACVRRGQQGVRIVGVCVGVALASRRGDSSETHGIL